MGIRRSPVIFALLLVCGALLAQDADVRPLVKGIAAAHVTDVQVRVSWRLPQGFAAAAILVYKGTRPFSARQHVAEMSPVAQVRPDATFFVDRLTDYREYYYAVVARTADGALYDVVLPSVNATVAGIRARRPEAAEDDAPSAPERQYAAGQLREVPLPYLSVPEEPRGPNPLSGEVLAAGRALAGAHTERRVVPLDPYIFEDDLIEPVGGDGYFLFGILREHFVRRDYEGASEQLRRFLGVSRAEDVSDRAVFYLAESCYFRRDYRQALGLFLLVAEVFPAVSRKWIESALDLYQPEGQ